MDDRRFDDLVRSLSIRLPRRGLGPLVAGVLAALGAPEADAGGGKSRRRNEPKREDRRDPDADSGIDAAGPDTAKKKRRKRKKPKPPTCGTFGAWCYSSYGCCGSLYCYDSRCAYSGANPCPDDQYDCGATCSWSSSCCPTGEKLCDGTCVAQTACCPACGAGQTCVNGTCIGGGTAGCAAGQKDCDGFCVPADACCPFCAVNQVCQGGVCQPLPCDASALEACLDTAVGFAESTSGTCAASCADPDSAACDDCILDWLLGDDLDVAGCYSMACEVSGAGIDIPGMGANCRYRALHDCRADVKKKFRSESITTWYGKKVKAEVLDCIQFRDCSGVPKLEWNLITSALGDRAKEYMGELSICKGAFGCEGLYGTSAVTQYSFNCVNAVPGAIIDGRCCMKGQRWDGNGCCWDQGVECAQGHRGLWLQPVFGKCCGTGAGGYQKTCKRGTCSECLTQGAGRAEGDECCLPQCTGKCGGDDGCGGTCPDTCPTGETCVPSCDGASMMCFRQQACPTDLCGSVAGPCNTTVPCVGSCAAYWDKPDYTCNVGSNNVARCGCPAGTNEQGPKCCPAGKPVTCVDNRSGTDVYECCDAHGCEKNLADYGVWGCCSAGKKTINRYGQPDCCSQGWIPGHPVGFPEDGCCLPRGIRPPSGDARYCCVDDYVLPGGLCP